ncbi:MAG: outer membrane protein assembly factor BamE [Pseudomonadota bacterium]
MPKIIFLALLLAGCSASSIPLSPYKIDIQQGNYVTQDMVAKLKPGMTRAQVRFALGTPLMVDPFRTDRWDYVYVFQKGGAVTEHRRLAVFFKEDRLERVEGDVVPARAVEKPKPAPAAATPKPDAAAAPPAQPAGAALTTTSGATVTQPAKPEPAKAESGADKPKPAQPEEEKGFFGRMLEKMGF